MASKVKRAHLGILKIRSSLRSLPSEPANLCHLVCTAFFLTGLQPGGCTKQLYWVKADRPFAWTSRLQILCLRLRKSCVPHVGLSKRRAHAAVRVASSWSARREGSLGAKSASSTLCSTKPSRTGGQSKRRGRELWRMGASRDQSPQRRVSCSTLGSARPWRASVRPSGSPARSAERGLRCGHSFVSF